ncbi:hypothetical protein CDD82_2767 [Ophiocordyceps australis]|uniref:Protein LOT5 n=1 Tax=Ophiocordyceps australis TaxID=1399860 RepID=A0A2C5ZAK3_9HYPO|nr:hypothetical protein CDD82_2767 [Ophiocordyceps australis]
MLPTTLHSPPERSEMIALAEYETQTPASFSSGKPILHHHVEGATVLVSAEQSGGIALFARGEGETEQVERRVDVYVTSASLTMFCPDTQTGVSIPYPAIAIHAIKHLDAPSNGQTHAVWMQLELSDSNDDEAETIDVTLRPPPRSTAKLLFDAISACAELHPNPQTDSESEMDRIVIDGAAPNGSAGHVALDGFQGVLRGSTTGDLPPPMPGSGGWITAENVGEYFDEQGNWLERPTEHEGTGRIRRHEEVEVNGDGGEVNGDSESKRPRVD